MNITIQPGDYVAVSDITCEAIHAAVVKCFEAAGGVKVSRYGRYDDKVSVIIIGLLYNPFTGLINWTDKNPHTKRQLTLQQLFTATNSIHWPAWAVDIRFDTDCVYFTDSISRYEMLIPPGRNIIIEGFSGYSTNLTGRVIALLPVRDIITRPVPETDWYDWSADKPRELPPVGEIVAVMVQVDVFADIKILAYDGDDVFVRYTYTPPRADLFNSKNWIIRPHNYESRKADLERERIIKTAADVLDSSGFPQYPHSSNAALIVLYEAGLLSESAV